MINYNITPHPSGLFYIAVAEQAEHSGLWIPPSARKELSEKACSKPELTVEALQQSYNSLGQYQIPVRWSYGISEWRDIPWFEIQKLATTGFDVEGIGASPIPECWSKEWHEDAPDWWPEEWQYE
ncbi:MAG: hypothetical protein WC455_11835 [Dehalococcoidia bacterium]|jgi:hypothetical protein